MIADNWAVGAAFSGGNTTSSGFDGQWSSRATNYHLGASMKYVDDATTLAGVVSYGRSDTTTQRYGSLVNSFSTGSDRGVDVYGAQFRVSQDFGEENYLLRSNLGFGISRLNAHAAKEAGVGALTLQLEDYSENHRWLRYGWEVGNDLDLGSDYALVFSAELAYQVNMGKHHTQVHARFAGADETVAPMAVPVALDKGALDASVGIELSLKDAYTLRLEYGVVEGERYSHSTGTLKISAPF